MSKKFDRLLEAATDSTLLEPNWDGIIACFDSVRAGEVPGKAAMTSIRKRLLHENPHVVLHALLVLDACVKNCGSKIINEVATRDFMEEFKKLGIESKYENVQNKVLEMLQCWAMAFANKSEYKIVVDTHNLMKLSGFDFPSIKEADAMFMAQVAPDWQEGTECFRCRSEFGLLNRKHHCRACGQIFCDSCSSREMPLPQFGIEKEVRVCDACFEKAAKPRSDGAQSKDGALVTSEVPQVEKDKLLREKEEEDLALAMAISKSEAEAKDQDRQKNLMSLYNGDSQSKSDALAINDTASLSSYQVSDVGYKGVAPTVPESPSENSLAGDDPLARYLNRDYWQQRKAGAQSKVEEWAVGAGASAPLPSDPSIPSSGPNTLVDEPQQAGMVPQQPLPLAVSQDLNSQSEATVKWCQELKDQVGVMESRIRSNTARGRPVVNDTAIQGLFLRLTELHSQVLSRMGRLDEDRAYFEGLQDHLAHIVDARSAVNELREESERRRQERLAEEQRMRQSQMKQTLDMMRMKKHAMLMEQRDMALQRFQQQEQEMQARRQAPAGYYPPNTSAQQGNYVPQNHAAYGAQPGYQQPPAYYPPQQQQYAPQQPAQQYQTVGGSTYYTQQQQHEGANQGGQMTSSHSGQQLYSSSSHGHLPNAQPAAPSASHYNQQQPAQQQQQQYYQQQQQHQQQPTVYANQQATQPVKQEYGAPGQTYMPNAGVQYQVDQSVPSQHQPQPVQAPEVPEAALISFD